jgi:hypothetical protein
MCSNHGYPKTKQIRIERRARAEALLAAYNERCPTLQDKLADLPPTGATKQRARLEAQIKAEQNKTEAVKVATAAKEAAKVEKKENKKGKSQ